MVKITPKQKAIHQQVKHVFSFDENHVVTDDDILRFKDLMEVHLHEENMSPSDIKKKYDIQYSDYGMFLKNSFGLKLKSQYEAIQYSNIRDGRVLTDGRLIYKKNCRFQFDPYQFTNITGYEKLKEFGIYHPTQNPNGVCRDHIISIEYGWRNDIDTKIISHPANCQFLTNEENLSKGTGIGFSIDTLKERIIDWNNGNVGVVDLLAHKQLPKTEKHKQRLREANIGFIFITNGKENRRVRDPKDIPEGFWNGMTRRSKMIK